MSHKVKKDEKKREMRGPTFVGLAQKLKRVKKKDQKNPRKKHKKDLTKEDYQYIMCLQKKERYSK